MNEVYCYDHHIACFNDNTAVNEEEDEDIQTIQSDAMTTSATLYHDGDNHSKKHVLSSLSSSLLLLPQQSSSLSPPPTTIHEKFAPIHQNVRFYQHSTNGTLSFLSSSQSLLYHTLTPTVPSSPIIMDVIVTKDHPPCNNSSNQYHDDRCRNAVRRIHDADDDDEAEAEDEEEEEENENFSIHKAELMNTNEPNVDDMNPMANYVHNYDHDDIPVEIASTMSYSASMSSLSGYAYFDTMTNYTDEDTKNSHHRPVQNDTDECVVVNGNRHPNMVYDHTGITTGTKQSTTGWTTTAALLAATTWSTTSTAYEDEDDGVDLHEPEISSPKHDPTTIILDSEDDNSNKKAFTNPTCSGMISNQLKQRFVCSLVLLMLFVIMIVGLTYGLNYSNGSSNDNDFDNIDNMTTNQTSGIVEDATNSLDEQDNAITNHTTDNIFGDDKGGPHPAPTLVVTTTNSPTGSTTDTISIPTATSLSPTSTTLPAPSTNIATTTPSFGEQNVDSFPSSDPVRSPSTASTAPRPQRQPPTTPMISVAVPIPTSPSFVRRPTAVGIAPAPVRRIRTPVRAPVVARTPVVSLRPPTPTRTTTKTIPIPVRVPAIISGRAPVRIVAPMITNIPPPMRMTALIPTTVPIPTSIVRRPTAVGVAPAPVRRIRTPLRAPVVARTPVVSPRPPTPTRMSTKTIPIPVRVPTIISGRAPVRIVAPTIKNIPTPERMTTLIPTTVDDDLTLEPSSLLLTATSLPTISPVTITNPPSTSVTITNPPSTSSTIVDIVTNTVLPTNPI